MLSSLLQVTSGHGPEYAQQRMQEFMDHVHYEVANPKYEEEGNMIV